jgi:hypothetical protein
MAAPFTAGLTTTPAVTGDPRAGSDRLAVLRCVIARLQRGAVLRLCHFPRISPLWRPKTPGAADAN